MRSHNSFFQVSEFERQTYKPVNPKLVQPSVLFLPPCFKWVAYFYIFETYLYRFVHSSFISWFSLKATSASILKSCSLQEQHKYTRQILTFPTQTGQTAVRTVCIKVEALAFREWNQCHYSQNIMFECSCRLPDYEVNHFKKVFIYLVQI